MSRMPRMIRSLSFAGFAAALVLGLGGSADAGFGHRHLRHADPGCAAFDPGCAAIEPGCSAFAPASCAVEPSCGFEPGCGPVTCCPTNPCITYRHKLCHRHRHGGHGGHGGCCPEPTYETVLDVTSPETGCTVAVPVCLPACCQGCPCQTSRCTLLGCGQVRYDYACGVSVIVRFQKRGDIRVIYEGF
jgi:hypothetical protein